MELPELEHFRKLQAGDITVYEMIFRTYYEPLCNYAYTYLQDKDEAEEIVQNAFLSVWEKRGSLEIRTSIKSYLYTMVRNASLNVIKHGKIKQRHVAETMALASLGSDSSTQKVVANELEEKIHRALDKLPTQCRLIFTMSRFEELKYAEIAEQLNISVKTVENQMGKALKIMREQLKDYLPIFILLIHQWFNP